MRTVIAMLLCAVMLAAQSDRDVRTFTLFKKNDPVQVGDVGLILKDTDTGKQRFKLVLIVNGHRIERKDQDILMPIYFYTADNQDKPHELVITKVADDQIDGRLVAPK